MIKLIVVGKVKEKYFTDAIKEYEKRLSKYTKLNIIEVADCGIEEIDKSLKVEKEAIVPIYHKINGLNNTTLNKEIKSAFCG